MSFRSFCAAFARKMHKIHLSSFFTGFLEVWCTISSSLALIRGSARHHLSTTRNSQLIRPPITCSLMISAFSTSTLLVFPHRKELFNSQLRAYGQHLHEDGEDTQIVLLLWSSTWSPLGDSRARIIGTYILQGCEHPLQDSRYLDRLDYCHLTTLD